MIDYFVKFIINIFKIENIIIIIKKIYCNSIYMKTFYLIIIIIILIYSLYIYNANIKISDLFKNKYLKKNTFNKSDFFIIKNENIKYNKFFDGSDVLAYPGYKKNILDVGDIYFKHTKNANIGHKLISFLTNSNQTHMLLLIYFEIDDLNIHNFKIPKGYKLVNPVLIHSGLDNNLITLKKMKKSKKKSLVGTDTLYNNLKNTTFKFDLNSFRYKNINNKIKNKIYDVSKYYEFSDYDNNVFVTIPIHKLIMTIVNIIQKLFRINHFDLTRNTKLFYIKNFIPTEKKLINLENFIKIKNIIIKTSLKLKKEKNIIKKKMLKNNIKKLLKIKKDLKNGRKFSCSEFVYYIYKLNDIDLLGNYSYNIKNINFAKTLTPKDLEKIILDNRFEYKCTIKNY